MTSKILKADEEGVRDLRDMRHEYAQRNGQNIKGHEARRGNARLAEVIEVPQEGDDYREFVARLVKHKDGAIEQVRDSSMATLRGGRPALVRIAGRMVLVSCHLHLDVQLTEDLDAATNFATGPATALANVLVRTSSGDLEKLVYDGSDVQVTVTNRYEHWDTVPAETFGGVILKNDEWRPDDFDCDAAAGGLI